jgi:hypothetical protein
MQVEYSSVYFAEWINAAVRGLHKVTLWVTICSGLTTFQSTLNQFIANVIWPAYRLIV